MASDLGLHSDADQYRQIYEAVALPVLVIDAESWVVLAVNEAAVAQYGYPRDEFVGLPILDIRPAEGRAEALRVLGEMPHGFWKTSMVRHQRRDGSIFEADVWSRDTVVGGRPVRVSTVADVTERVLLQRELQQAQKMEAVGKLAGGIAHDFNNALTAIMVGAELLLDELQEAPGPTEDLLDIRRAAQRAASLTHRLLAYSRQQMMTVELLPLNDVVARVETLVPRAVGGNVEVRMELDPETWSVRVDPSHFEQVILNLAANAQDAMPDGGSFTLATRNVTLERGRPGSDRTIPPGEYAELIARDTGMGMDGLTRARIFDPFFTTKPPPLGTGLGLSMVYGLVRQSHGFITVESEPEKGATFRILLPRADRPVVDAPHGPRQAPASEEATVLVVEGEAPVSRVIVRVLEQRGCTVLTAADGEEALALVQAGHPRLDLLVTDLIMPRVGGRQVADQLTAIYPDLGVLFMSGHTEDASAHLGTLGPDWVFLTKPFSVDDLRAAVRRLLDER